jgi:arylamine N-acetyltransferase
MANDTKLERDQSLIEAYRERLHLSPSTSLAPTLATLRLLTERHLQYIPFENLSMHLKPTSTNDESNDVSDHDNAHQEPPVVLSPERLIDKILVRRRGGCCLELNGLFRMLLDALGYPTTTFVPCWVFAGRERGHASKKSKFRTKQSHFVILVSIQQPATTTSCTSSYIVDVGLGEPPLGPLVYSHDMLDQAQETPEAMQSRIVWDPRGSWVDGRGRKRTCILLEWLVHGSQQNQNQESSSSSSDKVWEPRLQWDVHDAPLETNDNDHANSSVSSSPPTDALVATSGGPSLESFRYVIDILTEKKSSFARKIIVCRLTRTEKITLSGRTLKITSDRFGATAVDQRQTIVELDTEQEVMTVLKERFGIVLQKTEQLSLVTSDGSSNSKLWDHL